MGLRVDRQRLHSQANPKRDQTKFGVGRELASQLLIRHLRVRSRNFDTGNADGTATEVDAAKLQGLRRKFRTRGARWLLGNPGFSFGMGMIHG